MDKIAEPAFATCFNKFIDALTPVASPDQSSVSTTITGPPVTSHGERQIVLGQSVVFKEVSNYTVMNFFVQVGRGIVYVDPTATANDDLGPTGQIEKTVAAATAALAAALESK